MKTISYKEKEISDNPHGVDVRKLVINEKVQIVQILLKPGEQVIKHSAPVDVYFYILEGVGDVEIGDEKQAVKKDTLIESPKNIPHCLYNTGLDEFRVLVIKV